MVFRMGLILLIVGLVFAVGRTNTLAHGDTNIFQIPQKVSTKAVKSPEIVEIQIAARQCTSSELEKIRAAIIECIRRGHSRERCNRLGMQLFESLGCDP